MTVDQLVELLRDKPGNAAVLMHSRGDQQFSEPEEVLGPEAEEGHVVIYGD